MPYKEENVKINKKKERRHPKVLNTLEPGWVAPDGGWGWIIIIATGCTYVFTLMLITTFGLIFRERFLKLGINTSQTTMLISINTALASFIGLANGPLYRNFSYRQVACMGGLITAMSVISISFMNTFYGILFFFSIMQAIGKSLSMSASSLALISYFKKKRPAAVGLAWAFSSIGSMINPQIVTILKPIYGDDTVLLIGGMAFNNIACALLLQPVAMHAKRDTEYKDIKTTVKEHNVMEYDEDTKTTVRNVFEKTTSVDNVRRRDKRTSVQKRSSQRFGSQYLYNDDKDNCPVREDAIMLETPITTLAKYSCRQNSEVDDCERKVEKDIQSTGQIEATKSYVYTDYDVNHKNNGLESLDNNDHNTEYLLGKELRVNLQEVQEPEQNNLPYCTHAFHVVIAFFDLDLLQDCVYVNLIIGNSLSAFTELNFVLLIPYILFDYGLKDTEVATIMSVLSSVELFTRITIPYVTTRVGWDHRTYFLIGIGLVAMGRIGFAHQSTYGALMAISAVIGVGKSLTLIFSCLVIPDHVSLEKLPAADGLQMVTKALIFFALGPVVGWIRDTSDNYTIMLHSLNALSYLVIISWIPEIWYRSWKRQRLERMKKNRV